MGEANIAPVVESKKRSKKQFAKTWHLWLFRITRMISSRLKSLKTQSKSDQKTSQDWFINWDKSKDLEEQKDELEKQNDTSKTALKVGIDQNFKESDPKNPTKDPHDLLEY